MVVSSLLCCYTRRPPKKKRGLKDKRMNEWVHLLFKCFRCVWGLYGRDSKNSKQVKPLKKWLNVWFCHSDIVRLKKQHFTPPRRLSPPVNKFLPLLTCATWLKNLDGFLHVNLCFLLIRRCGRRRNPNSCVQHWVPLGRMRLQGACNQAPVKSCISTRSERDFERPRKHTLFIRTTNV